MSAPDWMAQARAEGLVPAQADAPEPPWPVVLLTALGAWLAVPPFLFLFAMLFGGDWDRGPMPYIEGIALLALSVVLLRGRTTPLFLEQAAVPLLPTGLVCLGYGLQRDLPHAGAAWLGLLIGAALIVLLKQGWLRGLLGVGMAVLAGYLGHLALEGFAPRAWYERDGGLSLAAAALLLVEGGLLWLLQDRLGREARTASAAAALESALKGWWVVVLVMHAIAAGWSFAPIGGFSGGDGFVRIVAVEMTTVRAHLIEASRVLSVLFTLVGTLWLLRRWRPAGSMRLLPPLLVLLALAALMPALGGILLVLALMASTRRWRLAALAGVAAVWALGALYYEWQLPLAHKSLALVAAGVVLAAWVRWLAWHPAAASGEDTRPVLALRGAKAVLLGAGLVALVLVNVLIAARERLIAEGRPVFVKLAPVDPRSLMQGDYMRLNYDLPSVGWRSRSEADVSLLWGARPRVAVTLDARGIAQSPKLLAPGEAPPAGAQLLELAPKGGQWTFVTDAWFFKEGEAERWQPAKYGEFRVTPEGKGLLVRVVGEDLKPL